MFFFQKIAPSWKTRISATHPHLETAFLTSPSLPPLPVHLPDAPAVLHFKFLQNSLGRAQKLFKNYWKKGQLQSHLFLIVGVRALSRNHWKHYQPSTNRFRCPCQLLELEPPIIHALLDDMLPPFNHSSGKWKRMPSTSPPPRQPRSWT